MKRILFMFIAIMACQKAWAHDFEAKNANGKTIYYSVISDSEVAVTYRGNSSDSYSDEYTRKIKIPAKVSYSGITYSVTSIGSGAFEGCTGLTSVTIPNSIIS